MALYILLPYFKYFVFGFYFERKDVYLHNRECGESWSKKKKKVPKTKCVWKI